MTYRKDGFKASDINQFEKNQEEMGAYVNL